MSNDPITDIDNLAADVREALASGEHVQETVHRLTLKAMHARHVDPDSLRRIIAAVVQGVHDGASQQLMHTANQAQAAKAQITAAIAGLDTALAGFAQASKLAIEEAAGQARKYSDTELSRTRSDLEGLENLFLDTLHHTASTAQGLIADILHDLGKHARNNGTAVGSQLKETLATLAQQVAAVGHAQLESGVTLAQKTAEFVGKFASGVLSGIKDRNHH